MTTLAGQLALHTREAELYERLENNRVRCYACGHACPIGDGLPGVCKVRFNRGGTLYAPHGYVNALQVDPIEKKPFYHVEPGARALSFGMLGCDLHCAYCQNWVSSQALRDPLAHGGFHRTTPGEIVGMARETGSRWVVSTYNEPLITAEWAVDIFRAARAAGLYTAFVSNGNGTPRALEYLRPHLDACKIDLKSFDDRRYRQLGGRLQPILDTIAALHGMGVWIEVVTLLVPGFNDSAAELEALARFLSSVSPDIPWHVTAFHPDYKMTEPPSTAPEDLFRAARIGARAGLRYIYAGNRPGSVEDWENTRCPHCSKLLVRRWGFRVLENHLDAGGRCPACQTAVPGLWRLP
jgi:pyruvate formate lyase activating enzyme